MLEPNPHETAALLDEVEPVDRAPVVELRPALWALPPEAPLAMPEQGF